MINHVIAAWLLCLILAGHLQAAEPVYGIREAEVVMALLDVDEIYSVAQNYTANLAVSMRWQDKSLAHNGPGSISRPLADVWYPNIQILNQQRLVATFPKIVDARLGTTDSSKSHAICQLAR